MNSLSIIIVNWNAKKYLEDCLSSIFNSKINETFEVLVVDNNSSDGSVNLINYKFPNIKLILNKENLGFPKANNQAIEVSNGNLILLLNPDTKIFPDSIQKMINFLKENENVGIIGPKILDSNGFIQYEGARNFPTLWGMFCKLTFLRRIFSRSKITTTFLFDSWDHKDSREVPCVSGACMMIRKKVIDEVGFLDELLPMYLEDIDICYRIKKSGWKIYYLSEAEVIHFGGQSSIQHHKNKVLFQLEKGESIYLFFRKHQGFLKASIFRIMILILSIYRIIIVGTWTIFLYFMKKRNNKFHLRKLRENLLLFKWSLDFNKKNII